MLGWVLSGLISMSPIAAIAAVAAAVVVISIVGIISQKTIKKKIIKKKFAAVIVNAVDNCSNTVKVTSLDDKMEYELHGDGVAEDIRPGMIIV